VRSNISAWSLQATTAFMPQTLHLTRWITDGSLASGANPFLTTVAKPVMVFTVERLNKHTISNIRTDQSAKVYYMYKHLAQSLLEETATYPESSTYPGRRLRHVEDGSGSPRTVPFTPSPDNTDLRFTLPDENKSKWKTALTKTNLCDPNSSNYSPKRT
jgi:hypothetical protein